MQTVISILLFIIMISVIIFIHEFGHYLIAKQNGVGVVEFSIGMGPAIYSKVKNGTEYSIRAVPFGGYCMLLGQESFLDEEKDGEAIVSDEEHSFANKNVWQRIAIILAGPVFNFILALVLALVMVSFIGTTTSRIGVVAENYPAEEAGLKAGDEIIKLNKTRTHLFQDITMYLTLHEGEDVDVTYVRDGNTYTTTLKPKYDEENGRYMIGIGSEGRREHLSFGNVLKYGYYEFAYSTTSVVKSLGMLVSGKASLNDLSGPVGMASIINNVVDEVSEDTKEESTWTTAYWIFINMLSLTVLISANLGVVNLLPVPGLDGGRLIFLIIEAITGKPVPKKFEGIVTIAGFVLLALLMAAVLFNDIRKIFM